MTSTPSVFLPRRPGLPLLAGLLAVLATLCSCVARAPRGPTDTDASTEVLRSAARQVVRALHDERFDALARWAHPRDGILFAPYAHVEPERHVTLFAAELRAIAAGETVRRTWGRYDGSGKPIRLTFRDYVERFVYDAPYLEQGRVAIDQRQGRGNALDNTAEVWPQTRIVEYHVPGGESRYGGIDWSSLRLAFERTAEGWRLVGIVHDQWTI